MPKLKLTEILKMEKTHVNEGFHNFFIRTFSWGLKISWPVNPIIVALRLWLHDSFTISHGTSNHVSHVRPCLFKPAYWSLSFKCLEPEYTVVYVCTLQARSVKSRFLRTPLDTGPKKLFWLKNLHTDRTDSCKQNVSQNFCICSSPSFIAKYSYKRELPKYT